MLSGGSEAYRLMEPTHFRFRSVGHERVVVLDLKDLNDKQSGSWLEFLHQVHL